MGLEKLEKAVVGRNGTAKVILIEVLTAVQNQFHFDLKFFKINLFCIIFHFN